MQKTERDTCRYFRALLKESTIKYVNGQISISELKAITNTAGKYLALLIIDIVEEKRLENIPETKLIDNTNGIIP